MNLQDFREQYRWLNGLDDELAVDVIHQRFYPNEDKAALAKGLGVNLKSDAKDSGGFWKDAGITALKSAISVPEAAVGLADILTMGGAGKLAEEAGFRPKEAKALLDEGYSDRQKAAFKAVQDAEGFTGTMAAALSNPSVIAHSVGESIAPMLAGGIAARGLMGIGSAGVKAAAGGVGPAIPGVMARTFGQSAPIVAGAAGEGLMAAGSAAEQIRQQTQDGYLTGEQAALAGATGIATSAFGLLGGKIAQKLGIGDVDTMLVGAARDPGLRKGVVRSFLEGAASEGFLEELPQSVSEQVLQNMALNKPLDEGVDQAAVMGLLAGGAMGGGAGAFGAFGSKPKEYPADIAAKAQADALRAGKQPETGALTKAVNAGTEAEAQKVEAAGASVATADKAMADMERQAQRDLQGLRDFASKDGFLGSSPASNAGQVDPRVQFWDEASAQVVDSPFSDRILTLKEQLADPANRERVRARWGEQGLSDIMYYAGVSDRTDIPERTQENMLTLAERLMSESLLSPIQKSADVRGPVRDPLVIGDESTALQQPVMIGMNQARSGRFTVDAQGNAVPETTTQQADAQRRAKDMESMGKAETGKRSEVKPDPVLGSRLSGTPMADMMGGAQDPVSGLVSKRRQAVQDMPSGMAPRTRTDGKELAMPTADPVRDYVDVLRKVNTPAAKFYVSEFDAGRITDKDVRDRMQMEQGKTPDQRIADAAAQAPKSTVQPGDILNPSGQPFKTLMSARLAAKQTPSDVIEVVGGYSVRPKEQASAQQAATVSTGVQAVDQGAAPVDAAQQGDATGQAGSGEAAVAEQPKQKKPLKPKASTPEKETAQILSAESKTDTSPFEHSGLKIRTSRVKVGDEVKDRWVVQSPENAEREARGERQIGGDRIVDTREQAIAAAEQESKSYAERKEFKAKADAEEATRKAQDEAKKEANRGKSVVERRRDAILDKPSTVGQGTKREVIETAVRNGRAIVEKMVDDTAAKKRDREAVDRVSRAGYILGLSNENIPVVKAGLEAQARLKTNKYEKPEYRMYSDGREDGPFREISKTEYDHAQAVKAKQVEAAKPAPAPKAEDLPDGWTAGTNGFTGRSVYRFNQGVGQPFAVVTRTEMGYEVQIRHGDKLVESANMPGAAKFEALSTASEMLAKVATHKDPGESSEVATSAVVTESLTKAAKREDVKPADMKKWLLGEIDKAMLAAPDRNDYDDTVKGFSAKDAEKMWTENGPFGKNTHDGFLTFDVPGDGKFKVRNGMRGLLEFKQNVERSKGFSNTGARPVAPEQNKGVQGGSGGQMSAITNMIEEGDFEAARDYAEAVGLALSDVKVPRGERKPQWDAFLKDGTIPPQPDTKPLPPQKTAAELDAEKKAAREAEAKKPKDTGWNMSGTGYAGKRYVGRNIITDDGREIVARVYENAGAYEEAEVKVDGVRKFTVTDRYSAREKADAFIRALTAKTAAPAPQPAAVPAIEPAQAESPKLTQAEAKELMAWQDLGTKDGVKTHILTFYESKEDKDALRGRMIIATITKGDRSANAFTIDGDDQRFGSLAIAKKRAMEIGMAKAVADGYVEAGEVAAKPEPKNAEAKPATVENFGEKLPPARRAMAAKLNEDLTDDKIASMPLSQIWPATENDAIEDTFAAAVAHVMRSEIPAKPRVSHSLKSWAAKVQVLRGFAANIVSGKVSQERFLSEMGKLSSLRNMMSKIKLLEQIDRADWVRIGDVTEAPDAIRYEGNKQIPTPSVSVTVDGRNHWLRGSGDIAFHLDSIKAMLGTAAPENKMQFEIRQESRGDRKVFINKKGDKEYRRLMTFDTVAEARAAMQNQYTELVAAWEGVKSRDNITERDVRSDVNRDRTGKDHRKGKDVSAEDFESKFGFRGGEFGKWVKQGDGAKERQFLLNNAYDALMDLSDLLGIPPKAISLEGTLGIAFGSRGSGAAAAHFEPSNLVINLTKTRGAGSLAHEWFHALDNYFARKRGGEVPMDAAGQVGYRNNNYITHKTTPLMVRKDGRGSPLTKERLAQWRSQSPNSSYLAEDQWHEDPRHKAGVRVEVEQAFNDLVAALNASPMLKRARVLDGVKENGDGYWSRTLEMAARSFENFVQTRMMEQGYHNDFLANVKAATDVGKNTERYPYLMPNEIAPIASAFDGLFGTIQTKETNGGNVALFSQNLLSQKLGPKPTLEQIQRFVQRVQDVSKNIIPVTVVGNPAQINVLDVPTGSNPTGALIHGQIYLFADNIKSVGDAYSTLFHEIFHLGLQKVIPAEAYSALLKKFAASPMVAKYVRTWKQSPEGVEKAGTMQPEAYEALANEEALAMVSEALAADQNIGSNRLPGLVKRMLSWFAQVADQIGFPANFGNWMRGLTQNSAERFVSDMTRAALGGDNNLAKTQAKYGTQYARLSSQNRLRDPEPAEFEETAKRIGGPDAYIKAFDARSTVLTYRQWVQVRTPSFKKWWGYDWENSGGRDAGYGNANGTGRVRVGASAGVAGSGGKAEVDQGADAARFDQRGDGFIHERTGEPRVFQHGTKDDFTVFDVNHPNKKDHGWLGAGHYFTSDPWLADRYSRLKVGEGRPRIMEVFVKPNTPRVFTLNEKKRVSRYTKEQVENLSKRMKNAGHGGGILRYEDDSIEVMTFDPAGIKSATSNNGDFDPNNPDIRFRQSGNVLKDTAKAVTDRLGQNFSAPGKISWWDKTVGSMYHMAERYPAFKPVFEAAQNFINDVSYYGTEAANEAPRLLPKLDTWSDLLKSAISAADNDAVAAPVFEGTLVWARDESGTLIKIDDLAAKYADLSTDRKARMLMRKNVISEAQMKAWKASPLDIYEGAIRNRFEESFLRAGVVFTDAELKAQFKLNDDQIALYREFRAAADLSLDNMTKADMLRIAGKDLADMRDEVMEADLDTAAAMVREKLLELAKADPAREDVLTQSAASVLDRAAKANELKLAGYAPLSRFGKYTVDVVVNGERKFFSLYETAADANRAAEQMRSEFGDENVEQGTLSQREFELFQGITPESLELFGNMLGLDSTGDEAQDKAFQDYLRLTKSNRSALKRLIHRKGIEGYSEDVGRVLASFVYSNARQTSAALHIGEMGEAIAAIPKGDGELKDAAIELGKYVKEPREEAHALRGLLFAQYLGGSVASAMINFSQPLAVSIPYLSQFGGIRKAAAAWRRAVSDMTTGKELEPALAKAMKVAEEKGVVSPQEVHQLMAQARGTASLRSGDGTVAGDLKATGHNSIAKMAVAWGKLFGFAEQVNRRSTFIAAYRMAVEKGIADPSAFAEKAVNETQFINNKGNKMKWGRGAIGATAMTFKSYSLNWLELMHRLSTQNGPEGKLAAAYMLGALMLMSGAGGLPFAGDAEDVVDGIAQRLGYNFSSKKAKQQFLEDTLGKTAAGFIEKGITGIPGVPIDIAGRTGMGNLIPGTGLFLQKTSHTRDVMEFAGPAGDLITRGFKAADQLASGEPLRAAETIAPRAVSNAVQGIRMAESGMYKDAKGYKVLDTDMGEAVVKFIGFQPHSVANVQESNYLNQRAKDFYNMQKQAINAKWANGIFTSDPDEIQEARDMVKDWNENNPEQRITVNMPVILKRVREMRKDKAQRIADTAPKAMRAAMREEAQRQ